MKESRKTVKGKEISSSNDKKHLASLKSQDFLKLIRGVLHHINTVHDEQGTEFVLPESYVAQAFSSCHDDIDRQGIERTISILQSRIFSGLV